MSELYLFATIGGERVAFRTTEIEAVVKLRELTPVPGAPRYVAGLSALRSRVLTIINAAEIISARFSCDAGRSCPDCVRQGLVCHAIVCEISGHSYGLLVNGLEDIRMVDSPPMPVCGRLDPAWQPHVRGVIENEGQSYFILSVATFLGGGFAQAA